MKWWWSISYSRPSPPRTTGSISLDALTDLTRRSGARQRSRLLATSRSPSVIGVGCRSAIRTRAVSDAWFDMGAKEARWFA